MSRSALALAAAAIVCLVIAGCSAEQRSSGSNADSTAAESPSARSDAKSSQKSSGSLAQDRASSEPMPPPRPMPRGRPLPAPPNGEAYDDMYFEHAGTNPFVSTEDDPISTFAIDVDTGSYTIVRSYIAEGVLPPKDAVRVEEFVNYFQPEYAPPREEAFSIRVDGGPSPFGEGYELVRIGLKGKDIAAEDRKPANLTFVIDASGSMARESRIGLVQKSLRLLVDNLQPSDQIAIVSYGSKADVILAPTSLEEPDAIHNAIDSLDTGGSTNAEDGLRLGYNIADRQYDKNAINRVILLSDGVANVGATSAEAILETISEYAEGKRITLTTVGVGMGNYNDTLMEQLADRGDGVYAYVDSFTEARRLFVENIAGTLQTIARDAKIQVEFDPAKVDRYRLIGYENRDLDDDEFRDESVDAGEVGAGHTVTALYEVKLKSPESRSNFGTARIRYMDEETGKIEEWTTPLSSDGELTDELAFLAAVAEYAEILRGSYWARGGTLEAALSLAERSASGEREQQFVTMAKDTAAIPRR